MSEGSILADEILTLPPVQWERHIDGLMATDPVQVQVLSDKLAALSAQVATMYGYVQAREHGEGHAKAVKSMNRLRARVRKVLGYSYPEKGGITF